MKKTLTVNLGGTVFHIDEDAYRLLDNYLRNLKLHFRRQEGAEEIVNDMEVRISELFSEKLGAGLQVISIADVEEIIARMGKPEEMDGGATEDASTHQSTSFGNSNQETAGKGRRLYRNPDDKMLGGVCSGIAAYFGWDVTLVRILFFVLMFASIGWMLVAYIALWLILPEARTATEKLNMRGEDVTVENIGRIVTDGFERVAKDVNDFVNSGKPRTFFQQIGDFFVEMLGFLLKAGLIVLAIIFTPVLLVLAIFFVILIVAAIGIAVGGGAALFDMLPLIEWSPLMESAPMLTLAGSICVVLLIVVPLIGLVYSILRHVFNWMPMAAGLKWAFFIIWIIALIVGLFCLSALGWPYPFLIIGGS